MIRVSGRERVLTFGLKVGVDSRTYCVGLLSMVDDLIFTFGISSREACIMLSLVRHGNSFITQFQIAVVSINLMNVLSREG